MAAAKKPDTATETQSAPAVLISDSQIDKEAEKTGDALRAGEKVRIKIPSDKLNKDDTVVPVCVNGHLYRIKRGEAVEVPKVVAQILEGAGYI